MTRNLLAIAGSEVSISRIGFGCARIFGGRELKASARLVEAAVAMGIRHFDTAPSYGGGKSEDILGEVLAGVAGVTVTTKVGVPRPDDSARPHPVQLVYRALVRPVLGRFPGTKAWLLELAGRRSAVVTDKPLPPRKRLHRDQVLREVEESLKRLRRGHIDLYLVHEPDQFELSDAIRELFADLQRKGVIGAFGLAWDRVADSGPQFGTVSQGRYDSGLPRHGASGEARIFHGVLRYRDRASTMSPASHVRNVLAAHPDAAVIFSASTPRQIQQIMQAALPQ